MNTLFPHRTLLALRAGDKKLLEESTKGFASKDEVEYEADAYNREKRLSAKSYMTKQYMDGEGNPPITY